MAITWSSVDKAAGLTLSNGDLTVTKSGDGIAWIRATGGYRATGRWYYEVTYTVRGSGGPTEGLGAIADSVSDNYTDANLGGAAWGYLSTGSKRRNGDTAFGATYAQGDVVGVAVDVDLGQVWFSRNGVWQASGNPTTGENPAFRDVLPGVLPALLLYADTSSATANFGASAFVYTMPAGFAAWEGQGVPATPGSAHLHWRLRFYRPNDDNIGYMEVLEVEMRGVVGGADLCTGGIATQSSGTAAANAFDDSTATGWQSNQNADLNSWLAYQFPFPVNIAEYSLTATLANPDRAPLAWVLEYSDDGTNWVEADWVAGQGNWTAQQQRVYIRRETPWDANAWYRGGQLVDVRRMYKNWWGSPEPTFNTTYSFVLTGYGGTSGRYGANVVAPGFLPILKNNRFVFSYTRAQSGTWYDDDFSDACFIIHIMFGMTATGIKFTYPSSDWTYRKPNVQGRGGSTLRLEFHRTAAAGPPRLAWEAETGGTPGSVVFTEVAPFTNSDFNGAAEITVEVLWNGSTYTVNITSESGAGYTATSGTGLLPPFVGTIVFHHHNYQGSGNNSTETINNIMIGEALYVVEGVVLENGSPRGNTLRLYKYNTGELIAEGWSDTGGDYQVWTDYPGRCILAAAPSEASIRPFAIGPVVPEYRG